MSVEEMVKRLRHTDEYEPLGHDGCEAADKLEELAAENKELRTTDDPAFTYAFKLRAEAAEAALAEAKRENEAMRKALEAMLEPYEDDPCWHDHHGYCQAHFLQEDCCVAEARAVLSRNAGGKDAE